jgi:hypothetical protein
LRQTMSLSPVKELVVIIPSAPSLSKKLLTVNNR